MDEARKVLVYTAIKLAVGELWQDADRAGFDRTDLLELTRITEGSNPHVKMVFYKPGVVEGSDVVSIQKSIRIPK